MCSLNPNGLTVCYNKKSILSLGLKQYVQFHNTQNVHITTHIYSIYEEPEKSQVTCEKKINRCHHQGDTHAEII